jgi:hypothetical protein
MVQLRSYYILSHSGISPELAAGLAWPPEAWLNEELKNRGERWHVQISGGNYEIEDVQ